MDKICHNCGSEMRFDKKVPDGDSNGTTLDQYVCEECGAIEVFDD